MRVIFVNRFFYPDHSATSQMLSDLAFGLASDGGFNVCVVTSRQSYDDPDAQLPVRESIGGLDIIRIRTPKYGRSKLLGRLLDYIGFYFAATFTLLLQSRPGDIIVAKTDPPLFSVPAAVVCILRRAKLINWVQDLYPEVATALNVRILDGVFGKLLKLSRNWSLKYAKMNVVIGERMRGLLVSERVPINLLTVIHNWSDGSVLVPVAVERNPLRMEWGLKGKFVIGYSGNLGRVHEFATMLGAASQLSHDPNIVFLIIGEGAQRNSLEEEIQRKGLNNVVFKPHQLRERLHFSLGAADVHLAILRPEFEGLIVPSKYYGIAAVGRPVIFVGSSDGEIARIVRSSRSGLVVAPGDVDALVEAILSMRGENGRTQGNNARATFESNYDMPRALDRWRKVIAASSC